MSFYNMLFGMNASLMVIVSALLGFRVDTEIPRFRDVFTNDKDCPFERDKYDVLIFTRMGGGNYECWEEGKVENCTCPYCQLLKIEESSWYVGGYDDDFDSTYRTLAVKFDEKQKVLWDRLDDEKERSAALSEIKDVVDQLFPKALEPEVGGKDGR
jgi:hypothetical protein